MLTAESDLPVSVRREVCCSFCGRYGTGQHLFTTTRRVPRTDVLRVNDTVPKALGLILYKERGEKKTLFILQVPIASRGLWNIHTVCLRCPDPMAK